MSKYFRSLLQVKKNIPFKEGIEYLINYTYFYKKKIPIFYPILIPRQDTENIITISKKIIKKEHKISIYELGYGSNNINISLNSTFLNNINIDNNFLCYLTKNEKRYRKYIFSDWSFLINSFKKSKLIITNPPYIKKKELTVTNIQHNLIKNNLFSNRNGLKSIYNIIKTSKNILIKNGTLLAEHGYNQDKQVRYFSKLNGFNSYTFKDNNNIKRFIYLEK